MSTALERTRHLLILEQAVHDIKHVADKRAVRLRNHTGNTSDRQMIEANFDSQVKDIIDALSSHPHFMVKLG